MMQSNKEHFNQFFHSMLDSGIYLGPSAFEAGFVSSAHTNEDIDNTIMAAKKAFSQIK
jgi:glutamate-1-semialdehyde 2,1-aminomutase